jgi:hypothetical protein
MASEEELIGVLWDLCDQLMRLIVYAAPQPGEGARVEKLMKARDAIVVEIERIKNTALAAAIADVEAATVSIRNATATLEALSAELASMNQAIEIAAGVMQVVSGLASVV